MKFKYFLRGLGAGILFAAIIFFAAYKEQGPSKMTDKQIMERAKELGMVDPGESFKDLLEGSSQENDKDKAADRETSTEATAENIISEAGTTTEVVTTEAATEASTEDGTEVEETVTVTVARGSTSYTVCQQLQDLGIIDDASELDNYLIEKEYASRIRVGTHTLTKGMDFHAIAEAISDPL